MASPRWRASSSGTPTFFFETSWAHIIGVSTLLAFVGLGFVALASLVAVGDQAG